MSFAVEPARPSDLAEALDLLRRTQLPEHGVADAFGHYRVVRDEGHVVGVCGLELHGPDALLRSLAVDPHFRGEGIGSRLVDGVLVLAASLGQGDVYLLTTTARDFFARHDFVDWPREQAPAGIRASWEFSAGCPASSACMKRPAPAAPR